MSWMCPQCRQEIQTTAHQCSYYLQPSQYYQQSQDSLISEKTLLREIINILTKIEAKIETLEKK